MAENSKENVHVTFNMSIAGSVRQALQGIGRNEQVIGLGDDLSFGPIDAPTARSRANWVEDVVGYDFTEIVQQAEGFWREATSCDHSAIVWICFDDSAEYCGFLEFVWRIGDTPFSVIDATGLEPTGRSLRKWTPRSLGVISTDQMIEAGLFGLARPIEPQAVQRHRQLWGRLKKENAPLRTVTPAGLSSASIDHFDHWLTRHASNEWRKGARIVGEAMGDFWESENGAHVSDIWLWGRVCALAVEGVLEIEGDSSKMQNTMVRRVSN